MQDPDAAIRRTEAAMQACEARMRCAVGDLDYEGALHEKRALTAALRALHRRRQEGQKDAAGSNFSQNSASSDRIKTNSQ